MNPQRSKIAKHMFLFTYFRAFLNSPVGPKMPLEIPRMTTEGPEMPPETSQDDLPNPRDNTHDPKTPKKLWFWALFFELGRELRERGDNPTEQKWLSCDDVAQKWTLRGRKLTKTLFFYAFSSLSYGVGGPPPQNPMVKLPFSTNPR